MFELLSEERFLELYGGLCPILVSCIPSCCAESDYYCHTTLHCIGRSKLVSVASVKCDVEYDRECGMARKRREYVAGYRKGNCKQIVKEKCYRRRIGKA